MNKKNLVQGGWTALFLGSVVIGTWSHRVSSARTAAENLENKRKTEFTINTFDKFKVTSLGYNLSKEFDNAALMTVIECLRINELQNSEESKAFAKSNGDPLLAGKEFITVKGLNEVTELQMVQIAHQMLGHYAEGESVKAHYFYINKRTIDNPLGDESANFEIIVEKGVLQKFRENYGTAFEVPKRDTVMVR